MLAGVDQAAGEVVVVDVGLGDVRDLHAGRGGGGLDAVDVPLGVDHEGVLPIVHEVAAVAELRGVDDDDVHDSFLPEVRKAVSDPLPKYPGGYLKSNTEGGAAQMRT
ncbi:hypothetical protein [Sinomonas atrocyanea]